MTTITFRRSGDMAEWGIDFTVDLDRLTPNEADHLLLLVDKAEFFGLPKDLGDRFWADEFQYSITVETESRRHTVRFSDTTVPESLCLLLDELSMLAIVA